MAMTGTNEPTASSGHAGPPCRTQNTYTNDATTLMAAATISGRTLRRVAREVTASVAGPPADAEITVRIEVNTAAPNGYRRRRNMNREPRCAGHEVDQQWDSRTVESTAFGDAEHGEHADEKNEPGAPRMSPTGDRRLEVDLASHAAMVGRGPHEGIRPLATSGNPPTTLVDARTDFGRGEADLGPMCRTIAHVDDRSMISLEHVTKTYGNHTAVDDVTFDCAPGEITGFLGPNGAGKSTTMRIMVGLTPATSGQVRLNGRVLP